MFVCVGGGGKCTYMFVCACGGGGVGHYAILCTRACNVFSDVCVALYIHR